MRHEAQVRENTEKSPYIPYPSGYKLLIAMPEAVTKTDGGIELPDQFVKAESIATLFGCVIAMGPDAYVNKDKFPTGPWCKIGDWVMFRAYSGTRFKVEDQEMRLINDDTVEAVVRNPSKVRRSY
jgi:co-chaperonin GroES (HSP10)